MKAIILGVDLAWGNKMSDAVAKIEVSEEQVAVTESVYMKGDEALLNYVSSQQADQLILAIDAPTLCVNDSGSRPVDKECSRLFRSFEAGCHPVNKTLCARPIQLAESLRQHGVSHTYELSEPKIAMEVYPHPAMVRWFRLEKTIKYKKGRVEEKRKAFKQYQVFFKTWITEVFPLLLLSEDLEQCLSLAWNKKTEDLLDAYFCAFIGLWHYTHAGGLSQVLGDLQTGFMVIPAEKREEKNEILIRKLALPPS